MTQLPAKPDKKYWRVEMYMVQNGWIALVGYRDAFHFTDYVGATFQEVAALAEQHIDRCISGEKGRWSNPGKIVPYTEED